jgi:hypothetical protein
LTFLCRIWCEPSGVLSTKKSGARLRSRPLCKAQRVLRQRNASRNRLPLNQRSQRPPVTYQVAEQPSSRVQEEEFAKQLRLARYLAAGGSPPSRAAKPAPEAKCLSGGDLLQRRGLRPSWERPARKLARKNWRKKGGERDGGCTRYRQLVLGEGRSSGRSRVVDKLTAKWFRALADAPQLRNLS